MGALLEIKAGPLVGKRIALAVGESILIGRAPDRAQFAVPHDNHMSGIHFAIECSPSGCRVIDRGSTNGTQLNGAKIEEAMLASGDEIKSGQTVFLVRIVPDDQLPATTPSAGPREIPSPLPAPIRSSVAPASAPAPSPDRTYKAPPTPRPSAPNPAISSRPGQPLLSIGTWAFHQLPSGWQIQEGLGLQQDIKDAFPSSIGAMEEPLGPGITLQQYVEAQTKMFREYLREPKIDAALPPAIPGSAETIALEVRYSTKDGQSIYYQRVYARSGSTIGVLTLTTLEKDLPSVRPSYDSVLSGIAFGLKQ